MGPLMSIHWRETFKDVAPNLIGVVSAILGLGTMRLSALLESYILLFVGFAFLVTAVYFLFMLERKTIPDWSARP